MERVKIIIGLLMLCPALCLAQYSGSGIAGGLGRDYSNPNVGGYWYALPTVSGGGGTPVSSNRDITPIMFSDTSTTNYIVTYSSRTENTIFYAWRAFDGDFLGASVPKWATDAGANGRGWLTIDLQSGNEKAVNKYTITPDDNTTQAPKNFDIYGGSSTSSMTKVDSRTNVTWTASTLKEFTFTNSTAYRYYKIDVTNTAGGDYVAIGEIRYYGNTDVYTNRGAGLIPIMSANNAPTNYVASASSEYGASYLAWKAFDGDASTFWFAENPRPNWVQIDLGTNNSRNVTTYSVQQHQPTYTPLAFALLGSTDGSTWQTLDAQIGTPAWSIDETRYYSFPNSNNYRYYRLFINDIRGGGNYTEVGELQLYEKN